jgi:surfeit locus 1 family protein
VHPVFPRLDLSGIGRELPYPVPGFYVRADSTTAAIPPADGIRVPEPVPAGDPEESPHMLYALQWFAFALIAVVGGGIFLWRSRG